MENSSAKGLSVCYFSLLTNEAADRFLAKQPLPIKQQKSFSIHHYASYNHNVGSALIKYGEAIQSE